MRLLSVILFLCFVLQSCERDGCKDVVVKQFLDDAPNQLQAYLEMREEVLAIEEYKKEFDEKGSLSFWSRDSTEISQYSLPILKEWLNEYGGVGFSKNYPYFSYGVCEDNMVSVSVDFYHKKKKHNYHEGVEILDSLNLADDWVVHLTKCIGCGD